MKNFKPILFSSEMVNAILEDRKTQTRRIIDPQPISEPNDYYIFSKPKVFVSGHVGGISNKFLGIVNYAKYQPGDILWVRETCKVGAWRDDDYKIAFDYKASPELTNTPWSKYEDIDRFNEIHLKTLAELEKKGIPKIIDEEEERFFYNWKPGKSPLNWKPSIFMPKEACRIFLEVTNVRVELLQELSEEDAIAEGIEKDRKGWKCYTHSNFIAELPPESFKTLWQKINGFDSWNENPWVWVYDFKRVEKPANFLTENPQPTTQNS